MRLAELAFPNLAQCKHDKTSESTPAYNCIAFAAGDQWIKWWPVPRLLRSRRVFWPDGVPTTDHIDSFVEAFRLLGYQPCSDGSFQERVEKVAIYGRETGKVEHMAVQHLAEDGCVWKSKLGDDVDIAHSLLAGLEGQVYGRILGFLQRPRPVQAWSRQDFQRLPGYPR